MRPKLSIAIPIHDMPNGEFFLWRVIQSVMAQSFKDYEIVITKEKGSMAENTNATIRKCRGELVKILYLDDFFAHRDSLKIIVDSFNDEDRWLVTGCLHQTNTGVPENAHYPTYTEDLYTGNNCIGSPSVLTFRREGGLFFDDRLSWLLDCDLYQRYYDLFGPPKIVNDLNVIIGIGEHQTSFTMSNENKKQEHDYMAKKYS